MKRMATFFLALILVLNLTACSNQNTSTATSSEAVEASSNPAETSSELSEVSSDVSATTEEESSAAAESTASTDESEGKRTDYPLTITTYNFEQEQVEYTFEKAPEKVYVHAQNNIELLLTLGLGDKIAAATGLDGEILEDLSDEFAKIPYDDSVRNLSKEDTLELAPDFILGWYSTFNEERLGDVDFWHERNIATYMSLNSGCTGSSDENPRTVENELQDILNLGMIFDVQDKAEAIVQEIRDEIENVEEYLADVERLDVAILEDEGGTYRVYGEDTLGGDVAIAGGAELAVGKHGDTGNISAEDLIAANPYAIFMVWYDGYTVDDTDYAGEHVVKLISEAPAFASLDAVKEGRVYAINLSYIYCSGIRTMNGILEFAENLYPELYQ